MNASVFIPIVGMLALAGVFMAASIWLSTKVGPARRNKSKFDPYECGLEATPQPTGGGKIPIKYYVIAMLFIIFDIEIVFLYPWAVSFASMTMGSDSAAAIFALVEMVLFIITVLLAYIYVVRRGGLTWD